MGLLQVFEILILTYKGKSELYLWVFLPSHVDLFNDMDHRTDLGVVNYGVAMTTLEDVFLKLEGNEIIGEEGNVLF